MIDVCCPLMLGVYYPFILNVMLVPSYACNINISYT